MKPHGPVVTGSIRPAQLNPVWLLKEQVRAPETPIKVPGREEGTNACQDLRMECPRKTLTWKKKKEKILIFTLTTIDTIDNQLAQIVLIFYYHVW